MFFKKKNNEKGILETDFASSLIIFVIGSIAAISMYVNMYNYMVRLKVNENAIGYITEICEEIDAENYSQITTDRVNQIISACKIESPYSFTTTGITEHSSGKVKKVGINVKYKIGNQQMNYTVYKVKVKE